MPLTPLSPSLTPFLLIVKEAEEESWGVSILYLPERRRAVEARIRLALKFLGDPPLALRPSPFRPDEFWLIPRNKCREEPDASGPILYPPLRKAA